jgi:hypothetical protein
LTAAGWVLVFLLASALLFAVGATLSGRLYLAGWIQTVRPRKRGARQVRTSRARPGRLTTLGTVTAAMVVKDWRIRTRDLAQLIRFIMPVIFLVIIFALRSPRIPEAVQQLGSGPAAAMLALIPAWILLFSLTLSLGLSAVSLEGRNIWIYAASPNSTLELLAAKCWSTALPTAIVVGVVSVISEAVIRPGWGWAALAVVAGIALSAAICAVMVGLGAIFARFDWTDTRRMTNPAAVFVGMAVFAILTLGSIVLFAISVALSSATGFPLLTTTLAAMLIAVGGTVSVAALSLLVGNQRLRSLELG